MILKSILNFGNGIVDIINNQDIINEAKSSSREIDQYNKIAKDFGGKFKKKSSNFRRDYRERRAKDIIMKHQKEFQVVEAVKATVKLFRSK